MFTALIVVVLAIGYAMAGGAIGIRFFRWRTEACRDCGEDGRWRNHLCSSHAETAAFAGLLWPFLLPILAGVWSATRDKRADRLQAEIERLERELGMS